MMTDGVFQVAAYLAQNPDSSAAKIAEALGKSDANVRNVLYKNQSFQPYFYGIFTSYKFSAGIGNHSRWFLTARGRAECKRRGIALANDDSE